MKCLNDCIKDYYSVMVMSHMVMAENDNGRISIMTIPDHP